MWGARLAGQRAILAEGDEGAPPEEVASPGERSRNPVSSPARSPWAEPPGEETEFLRPRQRRAPAPDRDTRHNLQ